MRVTIGCAMPSRAAASIAGQPSMPAAMPPFTAPGGPSNRAGTRMCVASP
jgi:hypothetical protein